MLCRDRAAALDKLQDIHPLLPKKINRRNTSCQLPQFNLEKSAKTRVDALTVLDSARQGLPHGGSNFICVVNIDPGFGSIINRPGTVRLPGTRISGGCWGEFRGMTM